MQILLLFISILCSAFAEESIRVAVLEFEAVGLEDPALVQQLSDETRGGVLDVFPPATSTVLVLTRENIADVLAREGKDMSCIEATCAVGVGKNIGARFVIIGTLNQTEGVYSLTIAVYDKVAEVTID